MRCQHSDRISYVAKPGCDMSASHLASLAYTVKPCAAAVPGLQFFVRMGDQVYRDEVLWDVSNPNSNAERYAERMCMDLGLSADWYDAIKAHVQQQLADIRQVCLGDLSMSLSEQATCCSLHYKHVCWSLVAACDTNTRRNKRAVDARTLHLFPRCSLQPRCVAPSCGCTCSFMHSSLCGSIGFDYSTSSSDHKQGVSTRCCVSTKPCKPLLVLNGHCETSQPHPVSRSF